MSEYIIDMSNSSYQSKSGLLCSDVSQLREPIVRCRDCKRYSPKEGQILSCRFEYKDFTQWRSAEPDGYCAWGERTPND